MKTNNTLSVFKIYLTTLPRKPNSIRNFRDFFSISHTGYSLGVTALAKRWCRTRWIFTCICVQLIKIQGFHSIASTNNHDGSLYSGLHWDLLGWTRPLASSGRLWGSFFRFVWLWGLCPHKCFLPYIYIYICLYIHMYLNDIII